MIDDSEQFASLFHDAVQSIDAGDLADLNRLLAKNPSLATARLDSSPEWLRKEVGGALDGFFRDPCLLWFVTEDPVRNSRLPANAVDLAQAIIRVAKRHDPDVLPEQTDYALRLVCWSWIARDCGVKIPLIDALLEAGASLDGWTVYEGRYGSHADSAIYNKNYAAAEHLLAKGASLTLTTALCLGRWSDAERLAASASEEDKQAAFVQAALNGKAEALRRMLALGMNPTTVSTRNQSHGTAPCRVVEITGVRAGAG